jgi:hypothetical protein
MLATFYPSTYVYTRIKYYSKSKKLEQTIATLFEDLFFVKEEEKERNQVNFNEESVGTFNIFFNKETKQYFTIQNDLILFTSSDQWIPQLQDHHRLWNLWASWKSMDSSYISWIPEEVLHEMISHFL